MTVQSSIPKYPLFSPINVEMRGVVDNILSKLPDGLSEFTFLNLYLFRRIYNYTVSKHKDMLLIEGTYRNTPFFIIPTGVLEPDIVNEELQKGLKWSHISQSFLDETQKLISNIFPNLIIEEDRDNFDYLYLREHLAKLEGKEFHKKKTLINKFEKTYTNIEVKELTKENMMDATRVLEDWKKNKEEESDYEEAKEALELFNDYSQLKGILVYVRNTPVAWTLAEILEDRKTAVVLFEKALPSYKGSFQYVNYAFASFLDEKIEYINREQDLGDEGLRQAKMTYRPVKFIKKFMVLPLQK